MTRKLLLVLVLLGFAAPRLAQPTVDDSSWPEARFLLDRLGTWLGPASGGNHFDSQNDVIRAATTSDAGSNTRFTTVASSSLQANGRPQHANRVGIGDRANDRGRGRSDVDAANAPPGSTLASAGAVDSTGNAGELLAPDEDVASLSSADAFGASIFAACAAGGVKGFGFDPTTLKYQTTCGNYNWSAESGGVDGNGVASYAAPTTPGGNSEYLTCSAPGVGQSDAGVVFDTEADLTSVLIADGTSTTLALEQPSAGWIENQWRDRLVRVTSGPAANDVRRIASNDADTLILTTDRPFTNAPGGGTYTIRDDLGSVCWAAGERVKLNFMADAMLAQDHTIPGGHVLFPNFAGYDHGIYVDRLCGRKGAGSTAVSNGCPVLAAPLDEHQQRTVQAFQRVQWVGQGTDPDLAAGGRKNVWFIDDRGTQDGHTNRGVDPNDGFTKIPFHGFKSGLVTSQARSCIPVSSTDRRCVPASSSNIESGDNSYGRVFSFVNDETMAQDYTRLCISDTLAESGTCRGDRRISCTANGPRTSSTAGGCDFGGGPNGGDIGPCESIADALQYELTTQEREPVLLIDSHLFEFPETGAAWHTENSTMATVKAVSGEACGSGVAMETYAWPFTATKVTNSILRSFLVADWERWYNAGGGISRVTLSPNQYYGRDIDDDAVSDIGDCLSGGQDSWNDDEPGCEYSSLIGLHSSFLGGFDDIVVGYSSGSSVDGSPFGFLTKLHNSLIQYATRGSLIDASNWDLFKNIWYRNDASNGFSVNFTHGGKIQDQKFIENTAGTLINTQFGKGLWMDGLYFAGNRAAALIAIHHATDLHISNVIAEGNTGQLFTIFPAYAMANVTIDGVRAYSQVNFGGGFRGRSLISLGRLGLINNPYVGAPYLWFPLRNFVFNDIHMETASNDVCLFMFDHATGGDDPTINLNRTQFSITDASIDALNGATGVKALCALGMGSTVTGGTNATDASSDLGIGTLQHQPTWHNVRENGVPLPEGPPMVAAASAGDCNTLAQGTLVKIYDDIAVGACTDAGMNGILDGGGTTVSTCECNGAGAWRAGGAGDVVSTGASVVGGIPTFSDSSGNTVVDSGTTIVDGVLTLAPSTVRPNEIRYHEDADLGSNYVAIQAVSSGTDLIGDARLILTRVSRALAAASGARGPVVGAVSNGRTFDTPEGLCDLAYYAANGVVQSCIAGTAKQFHPTTATPSWIGCHDRVASGSYFEVVCNVE
jgi:hypothetical protein